MKAAFLLFFLPQLLTHLQSAFHMNSTVNILKGISSLKPAHFFPCLLDRVQTLHKACKTSGICSLIPFLAIYMQESNRTEPGGLQREAITLILIGPSLNFCGSTESMC
jgi:hypothetical protein